MTVRRGRAVTSTPEAVAQLLREPALQQLPVAPALEAGTGMALPGATGRYELFFAELLAEVEAEVPHATRSFGLEVARLAGVSLADWYRLVMREQ